MRCRHANRLQDRRKRIEAPGQLGKAMLHKAVPDDQTQWERSPTGDRRSADQIDRKGVPSWAPVRDIAHGFLTQSTFRGSMARGALGSAPAGPLKFFA